jgi:hypothetical protein
VFPCGPGREDLARFSQSRWVFLSATRLDAYFSGTTVLHSLATKRFLVLDFAAALARLISATPDSRDATRRAEMTTSIELFSRKLAMSSTLS